MQTFDDLLSIDQAAPILGISICSLRILIHSGKIKHMRIGPNQGRYRFKREWLTEYLESCICEPTGQASVVSQPTIAPISRSSRVTVKVDAQSPKDRLKAFKQEIRNRGRA